MLLISYDIADDKLRTKFSKFIKKYWHRIQFSVYEIRNSERVLDIILLEISNSFEKKFNPTDSVIIVPISQPNENKIIRYGYAKNDEFDFIFV